MRNIPAFIVSKWLQQIVDAIPDNCNQCNILMKVLEAADDMSLARVVKSDDDQGDDVIELEWIKQS